MEACEHGFANHGHCPICSKVEPLEAEIIRLKNEITRLESELLHFQSINGA